MCGDVGAEGTRVADRCEEPGDLVRHDVWNATRARRRDWFAQQQRVEQYGAQALLPRAQYGDVGGREECVGVIPIADDVKRSAEIERARRILDGHAQLAFADQKRL